jgi:alanine racemase
MGIGYPRSLSNKAQVLIRGKRYPVAGRVCMDQLMVNIEWDEAYNGDAVTLIGRDGDEVVSVYDVANWLETIPYEVLTNLNTRIPRRYFGETHADSAHPCNSQSAAGKGQPTCA